MSQQAPVFPKVLLQGLRFRDFEAIKNLRLDLTRSLSRSFQCVFVPIRAVSPNFGMLHFDYWAHHARPSPGWSARGDGGEGWIRTSVRLRGQIYSLLPLTTRPPLHRGHAGPHGQARHVAARQSPVNALHLRECHVAASLQRSSVRSNFEPAPGRSRNWSG